MSNKKIAVVTGTNRGIGFGFVEQLLQPEDSTNSWQTGYTSVFACCRQPENAEKLKNLQEQHPSELILVKLDLEDLNSIITAVEIIKSQTSHIDVLINNAAHISFGNLDTPNIENDILVSIQANCIGMTSFTHRLSPLVKQGIGKRIICISSAASSIGGPFGGTTPGLHPYKISKAAANMATALLATELANDQVIVIAYNPGGVMTEAIVEYIGADKVNEENGWMKIGVAVAKALRIVDSLTMVESGKFINHRYLDNADMEYKTFYPW